MKTIPDNVMPKKQVSRHSPVNIKTVTVTVMSM